MIVYHVTHAISIRPILRRGLLPMMPTNWVDVKGQRYGDGSIYVCEERYDAIRWAMRMDWQVSQQLGSGRLALLDVNGADINWLTDFNDPISQLENKGRWFKFYGRIPPDRILKTTTLKGEICRNWIHERTSGLVLPATTTTPEQP